MVQKHYEFGVFAKTVTAIAAIFFVAFGRGRRRWNILLHARGFLFICFGNLLTES